MDYIIQHGGSGKGMSYWADWGTDCLVKLDIREVNPSQRKCCGGAKYVQTNTGWKVKTYDASFIGTIVHAYYELYYSIGNRDKISFYDPVCGSPCEEHLEEAWRVFKAWLKLGPEKLNVVATELQLEGQWLEDYWGIACTLRPDLIYLTDDNQLVIRDLKTNGSKSVDNSEDYDFPYKKHKLQRVFYTESVRLALELGIIKSNATGVAGFEYEQVVRTKQVRRFIIPATGPVPVTEKEVQVLKNYLRFCNIRKEQYPREYLAPKACGWCPYENTICTQGYEE